MAAGLLRGILRSLSRYAANTKGLALLALAPVYSNGQDYLPGRSGKVNAGICQVCETDTCLGMRLLTATSGALASNARPVRTSS